VSSEKEKNAGLTPRERAEGTPWMLRGQGIGRFLAWSFTRCELVGLDNVPLHGPLLIAANHSHVFDGPLLFGQMPRPVGFFVKSEVFVGPVGRFLRHIGQIPVRRGIAERTPIIAALDTLAAGGAIAVFPEGTRGSGEVSAVQHGIAYLAVRSGAPVLPVACVGTPVIWRHRRTWRRPPVRVVFGTPVKVSSEGRTSRCAVAEAAEQIRSELSDLVACAGALEKT
jgi:1-acyl-sn-glycerol-3-phosphate acyltransferase